MKSAIYEITGCVGSQIYVQKAEFDTMKDAKLAAREVNESVADGRGETFRDYKNHSEGEEGWTVAGKVGFDGYKIN